MLSEGCKLCLQAMNKVKDSCFVEVSTLFVAKKSKRQLANKKLIKIRAFLEYDFMIKTNGKNGRRFDLPEGVHEVLSEKECDYFFLYMNMDCIVFSAPIATLSSLSTSARSPVERRA